jgi:hypothetical protein
VNVQALLYTVEEKRDALERVLNSDTFGRADQLKRFLKYVCEMEMAGRASEISEYTIGTKALGRPFDYSPDSDSAVRGRAHALRQKLAEFYQSEGSALPLRIELRKGSYTPHYLDARSETALGDGPKTAPQQTIAQRPLSVLTPLTCFCAGLLVSAALTVSVIRFLKPTQPSLSIDSIVREFWGPLLDPGADVLVCVGSVPAMLLTSYKEKVFPAEPSILPAPAEVAEWYAGLHMLDGGGHLYAQTSTNTALFGDLLATIKAANILTAAGKSFQVLPENSTRALALRGRNVLMVGSPNYSPYAARIIRRTPFSIPFDASTSEEIISAGGLGAKPQVFVPKRDEFGQLVRAYGLLTVLPSLPGGDGGSRTVIFSGITSAGTQAAMEFFASPASLRDLKRRFGVVGSQTLPTAYQVVVRCSVDRNLALNWAYETHRILARAPAVD